jgi:hypothetical protein
LHSQPESNRASLHRQWSRIPRCACEYWLPVNLPTSDRRADVFS